jgi:hypothetical protein
MLGFHPMTVIDRLALNARKQKEFRAIVRHLGSSNGNRNAKQRSADIYFLWKYAGWDRRHLARHYAISYERVRQILMAGERAPSFTICHPKASCM